MGASTIVGRAFGFPGFMEAVALGRYTGSASALASGLMAAEALSVAGAAVAWVGVETACAWVVPSTHTFFIRVSRRK
jgi:hypothetical protein